MTGASMDRIELELIDGKIAITLRRMVGNLARVRHLTSREGIKLSRLLQRKRRPVTLNFEVGDAITLQIENRPHNRAWLGVEGHHGGRLVACLEGDLIREIGQCLHDLSIAAPVSTCGRGKPSVFSIENCYLD